MADSEEGATPRWDRSTQAALPRPRSRVVAAQLEDAPSADSVFDPPADRFVEGAELGRGGMGRVLDARDVALDRPVAIKHSLADTPDALARFEREARITARLQHPGVVPIFDTGRDANGQPYYIMRKIDGVPLEQRVHGADVRARLALVPAVLGAIDAAAYAHAQGIVHRDIKPSNILLGPFGETLLIDWGLAREVGERDAAPSRPPAGAAAEGLTQAGEAYGTPGFMAPEQARGDGVDRRADVYSLGATLYYVLVGRAPFAGVAATAAIARIAAGEGPDFARVPDEVPPELTAIAVKALAAAADARYADAGELAADVRRFLAGQLVAAHRYTAWQRVARWARRHRLAVAVGAAALVAIAVISALSISRVIAERDDARAARALAETRADEELIDRARTMVALDPTTAIALLRGLRRDSPAWPTARAIARAAVAGGIERRLAHVDRFAMSIAVAADGRIATGWSSSVLDVRGPDGAVLRTVADAQADRLAWIDAHTLAFTSTNGSSVKAVTTVDVLTGARTVLPGGTVDVVPARGGMLLRTDAGAVSLVRGGAATELAASGIDAIDANAAGAIALVSRTHLTVIAPDDTRTERDVDVPKHIFHAKLSAHGDRVAAQIFGAILEWRVADAAPARSWPRVTDGLNSFAYVGDALYSWSNDGSGVVALGGDAAVQRLAVPAGGMELARCATFAGGAVFATVDGHLAYADDLGLVELPHRTLDVHVLAAAPDGSAAFIGTGDGDLIALDLSVARPHRIAVPHGTTLLTTSATRAAVQFPLGDHPIDPFISSSPDAASLALVDLASGTRTALGVFDYAPFATFGERAVAVSGSGVPRALVAWDFAGKERVRVPSVNDFATGLTLDGRANAVFYDTEAGDVYEQPVDADAPRLLTHIPRRTAADGREHPDIETIERVPGGLAITWGPFKATHESYIDERGARHDLPIALPGWARLGGRTDDGTWWLVLDYQTAYRVPPGGAPIAVPLDKVPALLRPAGDHVWAISTDIAYDLGLDGRVRRTVVLAARHSRWMHGGFVAPAPAGLSVVGADANVRHLYRIPREVQSFDVTPDGRTVAAIVDGWLAVWRDPVPLDPAALPAYLDRLTNARLGLGSDAVTWD